jgi:hypothetical protein
MRKPYYYDASRRTYEKSYAQQQQGDGDFQYTSVAPIVERVTVWKIFSEVSLERFFQR